MKVKNVFCSERFYGLPWLDDPPDDSYCFRFLSLDQWSECSMTAHQTFASPLPFFFPDDTAHTLPQAEC